MSLSSIRMTSSPRPPFDSPSPTWRRILTARSPISYYDFIDDAGRAVEHLGVVRHLEYDRNVILRTNGAGAVRVWHRCVLERLGGFREEWFPDYAEDYDMILRLSERYAVGRVPEVLYRWRLHASNSETACEHRGSRPEEGAGARPRARSPGRASPEPLDGGGRRP